MTALVHLLCGRSGSGKTARLLERFEDMAASGFGTALWLSPNHRAVEDIRSRLRRSVAAHMLTFQAFAAEIIRSNDPTARPLSNIQRRLLAEEIVAKLHDEGELSHFGAVVDTRGFAQGVFDLLADLKRQEIWPKHLARAAYARGYSGPPSTPGRHGRSISSKDRQCARIYARYQSLLIRQQLYDLEGQFWYARDLLARGLRKPFQGVRAVFVDGFVDFTRTQREMLLAMSQALEELWITLPDEAGAERAELFTRPRVTREQLESLEPLLELCSQPELTPAPPKRKGSDPLYSKESDPFLLGVPSDSDGHTQTTVDERLPGSSLPNGLSHIERQLFRKPRWVVRSPDADGVLCLECPGKVGELRMVAREIKTLLLAGVPADDIVVTVRELLPYVDLVHEVFDEYGIPLDLEGAEPLYRNHAVATLLRALRLPEEDWPFTQVTALLRSGYFAPDWPEVQAELALVQDAEILLRLLGEPRSRLAYLHAIDKWADKPPPALEDEQAEATQRQRKHELAQKCRPMLRRFFSMWDAMPARASLDEHLRWLRGFMQDIGLTQTAALQPRDRRALERLGQEIDTWIALSRSFPGMRLALDRRQFHNLLRTVAGEAGLARTVRGPGRVRFLSAELARTLRIPHLFIVGLSERSFPRLVSPEPFFNEAERQGFKQAGLDISCVGDLLPDEMLLFYQLVTRATRRLVLSYPAVDEKGQALLPSSFLTALLECFEEKTVPTCSRRMLIEGLAGEQPLCPREQRLRVASRLDKGQDPEDGLPAALAQNLASAARLAWHRFHDKKFNPFDGALLDPTVREEISNRFGPQKVFSPTALEQYVACPFRFFFDHVLRLDTLDEPSEEVESTDRGLVFHRALSRLHLHLQANHVHRPDASIDVLVQERLEQAVNELAERASPAGKMLWQLEGRRLKMHGDRYRADWEKFLGFWKETGLQPRPDLFERGFGLPAEPGEEMAAPLVIQVGDVEIRIGGRIDRIDLAETEAGLTFWIIDYKTGRSSSYPSTSLASFDRLQLMLYALAAERVMLPNQGARPLGLAYWLVTDDGPKAVLPGQKQIHTWLSNAERWPQIRQLLEENVARIVAGIRAAMFPLKPRYEKSCDHCPYSSACRISQVRSLEKDWSLDLEPIA